MSDAIRVEDILQGMSNNIANGWNYAGDFCCRTVFRLACQNNHYYNLTMQLGQMSMNAYDSSWAIQLKNFESSLVIFEQVLFDLLHDEIAVTKIWPWKQITGQPVEAIGYAPFNANVQNFSDDFWKF